MARSLTQRLAATATLTALAAALALPALAQPAPASAPSATPGASASPGQPHHRMGQQRAGADSTDRHQQRQAYMAERMAQLKTQLKLTAAQEPAWTAFTAAMQPGERKARLDHADMGKLTTPERIDRMRAMRAQHAAEADRRGEATKAFYAALTPEQQKTFDAQAHHGRHHGMHGKGGRHGDGDRAQHGPQGGGMHGGGMHGGPMGQAAHSSAPAQK
ncbi:Spy/CpxP family protein refolding chaperone [Acidovorax sp. RAC01]|uniref:Spy/CpxP family protein refolding chaperone n=1 Tax=Acidovorax sp. RAC01 TaxID=1842533 RepID=UPI00083E8C65|nr:Spy/CpxP family protein refolding chaperone [Acidovorax sp. RAC01]AOG22077.1 LTXXQ motif family protein [Acidovorax sp. RAC01]